MPRAGCDVAVRELAGPLLAGAGCVGDAERGERPGVLCGARGVEKRAVSGRSARGPSDGVADGGRVISDLHPSEAGRRKK